jgi:hypothetical protein
VSGRTRIRHADGIVSGYRKTLNRRGPRIKRGSWQLSFMLPGLYGLCVGRTGLAGVTIEDTGRVVIENEREHSCYQQAVRVLRRLDRDGFPEGIQGTLYRPAVPASAPSSPPLRPADRKAVLIQFKGNSASVQVGQGKPLLILV